MLRSCIIYSTLPVYLQFVFFVFFVVNRVIVSSCHRVIVSPCHLVILSSCYLVTMSSYHNPVPLKSSEIETRIYILASTTYSNSRAGGGVG